MCGANGQSWNLFERIWVRAELGNVGTIVLAPMDSLIPTSRFVVLFHEFPRGDVRVSHWDLMLEDSGKLETWQLLAEPAPGKTVVAIKLPRHRLDYLVMKDPFTAIAVRFGACKLASSEAASIATLTATVC